MKTLKKLINFVKKTDPKGEGIRWGFAQLDSKYRLVKKAINDWPKGTSEPLIIKADQHKPWCDKKIIMEEVSKGVLYVGCKCHKK